MLWQSLGEFRDRSVPKLHNLHRAAAAGLRVPPTWWAWAADGRAGAEPPDGLGSGPLVIRSASPTEDQSGTSAAGQFLSLVVQDRSRFADSLGRVAAALPRDAQDRPAGAVFVQQLVTAAEAGVAFFDGFYYERTLAVGGNQALTAGQARGEVSRGQLEPGDPWSDWLRAVYAVFGADGRLDVEFARDAAGYVLFQVRPALFPVVRNQTLSLANHKETFGDLPSPWITAAMIEGGRDMSMLVRVMPVVGGWDEQYAVEAAGRAWVNVSLWSRLSDHIGMKRQFFVENMGGTTAERPGDRMHWGRLLRALPRLLWGNGIALTRVVRAASDLRRIDAVIDAAHGLDGLHGATAEAMRQVLQTALAIVGVAAGVIRLRLAFRVPGSARLVTRDMMEDYRRLTALPRDKRAAGLDAWLARHGHRGPFESDLARPRFAELRDVLLHDLLAAPGTLAPEPPAPGLLRRLAGLLTRPLFWIDQRREWFRDEWMRRWARLRARILDEGKRLAAAGELDAAEDVFLLTGSELEAVRPLRQAVATNRARLDAVRDLDLPLTATREEIEALAARAEPARHEDAGRRVYPGIALDRAVVEGRAVKAADLAALLADGGFGPDAILVVPALEPSWGVVFPRVAGVVAEVGGELSHASILLREARKPAVVNCVGIFRHVKTGDRLRLDGARGLVEVLNPSV
jgi:pyruvate,water dikinase